MRRQQQVAKVCAESGHMLLVTPTPLDHFSFIAQYNMLYCRIQKCGTTNWVEGTFDRIAPELGLHKYSNQTRKQKLKYFEVKNTESWNKIVEGNPSAFVVVRHPFERLVSGKV
jgi:hypothetical protein